MKVILKQDIDHLGQLGDVRDVAPGYARNYLIPRGMVISATARNMSQVEHERRLISVQLADRRTVALQVAERVNGTAVTISVKVGEDGRLFGSVTDRDLIAALHDQGVEVGRHAVVLEDHIKRTGSYEVPVQLGDGVTATLNVTVVSEAGDETEEAVAPVDEAEQPAVEETA